MNTFSVSHKLQPQNWHDPSEPVWDGFEQLYLHTSVCLYDQDEPWAYHKAAISSGFVLYPTRAIKCGINPYTLFDSINAEVWSFYHDCKLQKIFDFLIPSKVVVISQIGVNPIYRNLELGLSILRTWVANLSNESDDTLFLLHPDAINRTEGRLASWFNFGKTPPHKKRVDNPGDVLARYWQKAGFKNWPGTSHMYLSTGVLAGVIDQLHQGVCTYENQ